MQRSNLNNTPYENPRAALILLSWVKGSER